MEATNGSKTFGLKTGFALGLALVLSGMVFAASASAQAGGRPIIAGNPVVGETLTSSSAGFLGSYKWQHCDPDETTCGDSGASDPAWVDIPGENSQTYLVALVGGVELGDMLRVNTGPLGVWSPSEPVGPVTNPPAPEASTGVASGITDSGATLNGTVDPNGTATTYRFEYGTDTSYGSSVPVPDGSAGAGEGNQDVSAVVSGLSPATEYHFRLVAESTAGESIGSDRTFTTQPPLPDPEATTGEVSSITETTATLSGIVDPNFVATTYHFEYGTTTAYGSTAPIPDGSAGDGCCDQAVSTAISGLSPSTVYHYRLVASSAGGTSNGSDETFTTADPPPPTAEHGIQFLAETTAGECTVRLEGQSEAIPLSDDPQVLPVSSVINARFCTVRLTAATGPYANTTLDESMEFREGKFKALQSAKTNSRLVAKLKGPPICGPFVHRGDRTASRSGPEAVTARRRGRRLWGSGRGRYATAGRGGTGSVVGTTYLTEEKCKGTYFRVSDEPGDHGIKVKARGKKKPVFLGPGETFLAER